MISYSFLQRLNVLPFASEIKSLDHATEWVIAALNISLVPLRKHASIVVGGSYAKGTLVASALYDVDIFIRYKGDISELMRHLLPALREICLQHHLLLERVHGSREYFRIRYAQNIVFEIVPVSAIKNPSKALNVTDLSYTHVSYIKKELRKNKRLAREIGLAKLFCKAQRVYGAESYVQGFSGYALECLVVFYGSFLRMIKNLALAKTQIIIDPEKKYSNKKEILLSLNESKLRSPIVLVDPMWKERNVLAALSRETLIQFQKAAKSFLKKPKPKFFVVKNLTDEDIAARARKSRSEIICIVLETPKQPGDIAGTKLKKFADTLARYFAPYFLIVNREFLYSGAHTAKAYYFVKPAKTNLRRGPPLSMKEHARQFKKEHPNAVVKRGIMYAPLPQPASAQEYIKHFLQRYAKMIREMDISSARVA